MVATITSYDVELFKSAYDTICLIADNIWAYNSVDPYRKLNRLLWIKISKFREERSQGKIKKYVSDVIPDSRLSKYGNYVYNVERESLYIGEFDNNINESFVINCNESEPWLYPDVKEYFTRLITKPLKLPEALPNDELSDSRNIDDEFRKYSQSPYKISSNAELQLMQRIFNDDVRDIWKNNKIERLINCDRDEYNVNRGSEEKKHKNNQKQREIRNKNEPLSSYQPQAIIVTKNRYKDRECRCNKTTVPILSAEVPEFFPKGPRISGQYESVPLQYFPSMQERIYNRAPLPNVSAIFQNPGIPLLAAPMITPLMRTPHWLPRLAPPLRIQVPVCTIAPQTFTSIQSICPIIHRPIQLNEKIIQPNQMNSSPIPVYQRPFEHYHENRRKSNGVDFKNLILLTKSGMKTRKSHANNSQGCHSSLDESQINLKANNDVLQWLDGRYNSPAKDLIATNSIVSDLSNFEGKLNPEICETNLSEFDNTDELLINLKQ